MKYRLTFTPTCEGEIPSDEMGPTVAEGKTLIQALAELERCLDLRYGDGGLDLCMLNSFAVDFRFDLMHPEFEGVKELGFLDISEPESNFKLNLEVL